MVDKVYWIDGRPVIPGTKTRALAALMTGLFILIFTSFAAAVPLALAVGIGYALSGLTSIPLATAIALALGSMCVMVLFATGRKITGALYSIRDRMPGYDDGQYNGEDEE